jgi:hypothetical protein
MFASGQYKNIKIYNKYKKQYFQTSCCTFQKDRRKNLPGTWQRGTFFPKTYIPGAGPQSGCRGRRWRRPNAGTTISSARTGTQRTPADRSCQQLANKQKTTVCTVHSTVRNSFLKHISKFFLLRPDAPS